MDEAVLWYEETIARIDAALRERMRAREAVEDRLHERPLLPEEMDDAAAEVDDALARLPLPEWRIEGPDDAPWETWRSFDRPAFLAVVDWAVDEELLTADDEAHLCMGHDWIFEEAPRIQAKVDAAAARAQPSLVQAGAHSPGERCEWALSRRLITDAEARVARLGGGTWFASAD